MASALPTAFIDWLCRAFIETHFSSDYMLKLTLQQLARWRAGEPSCAIPGYDAPPPDAPDCSVPDHWSSEVFHEIRIIADRRATALREQRPDRVVHFV